METLLQLSPPDLTDLSAIPEPSARNLAVHLTAAGERSAKRRHPWIFDQAISQQSHEGAPGDIAVVFDSRRQFLAAGIYDPTSTIRIRLLQFKKPEAINQDWFTTKFSSALKAREPLIALPQEQLTTGYRVVNGENEGLPGLIIDRYDQTLVCKLYTPAWVPHFPAICRSLYQAIPCERLVLRLSRSLINQPEHLHGLEDKMKVWGPPLSGPVFFFENGIQFEADPFQGQKTGFFLDQRENRARVEKISRGKSVLNIFSYTGGFSVYAARGGAKRVVSVDLSAPACKAAERNMALNRNFPAVAAAQHETIAADAFTVLTEMKSQGRQFDVVIIDPPMFAQNQSQVDAALAAYRKLTHLGLGVLKPGGILVQASCTARIDEEMFFENLHLAANQAQRPLQEIERSAHAIDHPVGYREGKYLKCFFAKVA